MKHIMRFLIVILLLVAVGGAGYWYYQQRIPSPATNGRANQVVAVRQGSLSSTLSVVGQLEAVQSANLAFEHLSETTKLVSLAARAGQVVTAGQVLATVDPAPYRQALDQANSDLQAAEKTLADLKVPATKLEIALADVAITKANQQLEQARADLAALANVDLSSLESAVQDARDNIALLELQVSLAERDSTAKNERNLHYNAGWYERRVAELEKIWNPNLEQMQELAKDRTLLAGLRADLARVQSQRELARQSKAAEIAKDKLALADAQSALDKARAGSNQLELAKGQVTVQEAQVALLAAQDARQKLDAGPDATEVATAQANVDKKRLAVSQAEAALAATSLTAPFDGTVLETQVHAGDQIANGSAILAIANLKTLQVVASVDETTIRRVSAGQAAVVTFDAFPGQQFTGQVDAVPLQGALQGGVTVYDVPVSLTGADQLTLLVGMTANVRLQVASVTDALLVPAMALQQANGAYQVLVVNPADPGGPPQSLAVEVGLSDGAYTQVTGGLVAGDQVVVQLDTTRSNTNAPANPGGLMMSFPGQAGRR